MQDPEGQVQQQVVHPMCVALVDTTGTEDYLELVRCSLLAALEALPPCTEFGLATFSDKVTRMRHCHGYSNTYTRRGGEYCQALDRQGKDMKQGAPFSKERSCMPDLA